MFFAKEPAEVEMINDINRQVINFYKVEIRYKVECRKKSGIKGRHQGYECSSSRGLIRKDVQAVTKPEAGNGGEMY